MYLSNKLCYQASCHRREWLSFSVPTTEATAQVTPFRSEFLATSHEATGSPADVKAPSSEIAQTPPSNEGVEEQMPNPAAIHKSAAKESSASKDTSPATPKVSFAKTRARQAPRPSKRICRWNDSDSANVGASEKNAAPAKSGKTSLKWYIMPYDLTCFSYWASTCIGYVFSRPLNC